MNVLMSISDGIGLSFFCRKMETTRRMREEMDGEGVYIPPESAFPLWFSLTQVLFPTCTLTWRVDNYVSLQGKGKNGRNECTKGHNKYTDDFKE